MYLIDYHCHSQLSPDSSTPLIDNARAAIQMGISELCITDHFDLLTGQGERQRASALRWSPRVKQYHAVKDAVAGKLTLKLGIEFGSGQVDAADAAQALKQPELDFVIGSIHNRTEETGASDLYYLNYTSADFCYEVLEDYFLSMERLVAADCYDVLGHIIYPIRYMNIRDGQEVDIYRYLDRIRAILKGVVAHGRGIEFNTWCGRTLEQWRPTLEAYRDCGGEYITVGSDAHVAGSIGKGIREAYELLKNMGFRYVTAYEKRTPVQIKL